ncbi:MAG TPA: nucleoside transporter C-terminal domain-containing protein [Candidatus Eisenbacteria bacterium]|nr:nucleoside transporter C-terminal domain-containing protein [Candidatus Eisenbacteria bacterium]
MGRLTGVLGILAILLFAYLFSTSRKAIRVKTIIIGLALQFVFALLILRVGVGERVMSAAGNAVNHLLSYSFAGSEFIFGGLGARYSKFGVIFAFQVLPTIIFIAAFFAVLYHFGVMQFIIRQFARVMMRFMGATGVESMDVAASIFMGQTEAPLTIRPFLPKVTQSELMVIMTAGMAHVSGGIMGAYILSGIEARHLLAAVIMTAPGTIVIAKMLVPETEKPLTAGTTKLEGVEFESRDSNVLDAIAKGTTDGLHLALNVAAMLISFLALIALLDGILGGVHNLLASHGMPWFPGKLETIFGVIFAPIAWLIGVPWHDCLSIGNLLGTRMVLNELVAFTMLGGEKAALDPRSFTIATFALCGFANFSSIGIQIGGLSALAPNRRHDLARLGFRAMIAGTLANLMSASIVGILLRA